MMRHLVSLEASFCGSYAQSADLHRLLRSDKREWKLGPGGFLQLFDYIP